MGFSDLVFEYTVDEKVCPHRPEMTSGSDREFERNRVFDR